MAWASDGRFCLGRSCSSRDRVEARGIGHEFLEADAELGGGQPEGDGRDGDRRRPPSPAAGCSARRPARRRGSGPPAAIPARRPGAESTRVVCRNCPNQPAPPAPRSARKTMNCSAATNSLAAGNWPSLARLFQALLGRLFGFPALVRHDVSYAQHPVRGGPGMPADFAQDARKHRRIQLSRISAVSILAGKARLSSCSCALMRPSSASATSTITSSATTGSARRTPTENRSRPGESAAPRWRG